MNDFDFSQELSRELLMAFSNIGMDKKMLNEVSNIIYVHLDNYDINGKKNSLMTQENTSYFYVDYFIAVKKLEGKSDTTLSKYKGELELFASYFDKNIATLSTSEIRAYLAKYQMMRKISNTTLEGMRRTLSSFYGWLQRGGIITLNPVISISKIKSDKTIKLPFNSVERNKIRMACKSKRDLALTEFLYASGVRVSECASLNISDIDFSKREGICMGKGHKERVFYLSELSTQYLKDYLDTRTDDNPALFVFTRSPYNRLSKDGIEGVLRRVGKVAKVENVHTHRYRRTLTTDLIHKGVPIEKVSKILGHEDIRVTRGYVTLHQTDVKYNYDKAIA